MFIRLSALQFATKSKTKRDILEDPEEMKILSTRANFYEFYTLPISLWIFAGICISIAIFINYFIVRIAKKNENLVLVYFAMFVFYIGGFITIYAGKMEFVLIDKKKGIIKKTLLNCFLSKIEFVKYIDKLKKIEMVKKGVIRYSGDTTRYFIRYIFEDKSILEFGKTISFYEIQKKFRISKAILEGEVIKNMANLKYLTDESYDEREEN
jgi:hypothetical protein